jgi:hypothetical protein
MVLIRYGIASEKVTRKRESAHVFEFWRPRNRVVNFPLPTYPKWENRKSVGKWENGMGNGKMGKQNGRSGQTHLNGRLRYIETRKIDVGDSKRCKRREVYIYSRLLVVAF